MKLAPSLNIRVIRSVCITLFLSLFITFPSSIANAITTVSYTVTVKGSNNALYNGAQVGVVYFADGDKEESFKPNLTTGANGQVTISYPSNASYAQMFITPPESDSTNAVEVIDLLTSTSDVISNVKLKASNIRVKPQTPSGSDAGLHTCIDYPKVASSRWVTTQYRTTRVGAFGIAIPTTLNPVRDYQIGLSPCNKSDYNYLGKNFGLRRASNGTITLYTDDTFKTVATATSGVYSLKFDQGKVRGQIFDSSGNPFTIPAGSYAYLVAQPLNSDGSFDLYKNPVWADQITPDNKFSFYSNFEEGHYRVYVRARGSNPFPSFVAGDIWVDSTLKYSTSENGTYTSTLDLNYQLPSTGILKFAFLNASGGVDTSGGSVALGNKSAGLKESTFSLTTNEAGFASGQIPDGTYSLIASPKSSIGLEAEYTLTVASGVVTLKNAANQTISQNGDFFPLAYTAPTLSMRIVSPSDTTTTLLNSEAFLYNSDYSQDLGYLWNETQTSISRLKIAAGSYNINVNSYSQTEPLSNNTYTIDVDSTSVVVKNGSNVILPTNGIYLLSPKRPTFIGTVLNPGGTEAVRWAEVRAINATNPKYNYYSSTNSSGEFSMDLGSPPADGIYYVSATPPTGVNANYGASESVTVRVTNGQSDLAVVSIRLRTANVSGVVSGPNGPAPQNWLTVQESKTGTYLDPTINGPLTDEDGGYSLYLPTGTYGITPSSDFGNTGGVSAGPKVCAVGSNASNAVTCNISLVAPNVTGSVTLDGEKPMQSMIGFAPSISDPVAAKLLAAKNGGTQWSGWSDINSYGIKLESGTYRMWIAYQTYTNEQSTVPGPLCVVPETGTVTCDATLPAPNLKIQVADWNGNSIRTDVSASIQFKEGSNYFWTCCANSDPSLRDGKIQVGLINGSYKLLINSTENISDGTQQIYYFDVSGGSVTNMRLTESGTSISSSGGLYTLRLKEPAIYGQLYGTNGTTPKPYAEVRLYNSSGQLINSTRSDRKGRFVFEFDDTPANGTYYALGVSVGSIVEGNSKYESFTVLNGKATSNISLRLNTPNIVGTASGPLGVSASSYIRIQSFVGSSIFSSDRSYTWTNQEGKFAFYLPTGTYTFWGDTDFNKTGGVAGTSSQCIVNAESSTVTTCNLSFAAPNVTGNLSNAGVKATNSYVLFFPAYGIPGNTATNSYGWIYSSSGVYGINAEPGTYRSFTLTYDKAGGNTILPGPLCVVPSSGSVTCNITRGSPNFRFVVKSPAGNDLSSAFNYDIQVKNGDQFQSACCAWVPSSSTIATYLFDGSYKIKITPKNGAISDGTPATYTFDVVSGSVNNLQKSDSTTTISPVSGIYVLQTTSPNVQGTISSPKGSTEGIWIEVLQDLGNGKGVQPTSYSTNSDSSGKFALRLPAGVYLLRARPDYATTGGGDTTVRCEVISDTATAITCNIALSAPNVTGTVKVAGTTVAWGSIILRPASGIAGNTATEWYGWNSLNNGVFGINAKPGTYRAHLSIPTANKYQLTTAGLCVVPETGTVTCNINLPAPNFTINILDTNGATLSNAGIELGAITGDTSDSICCDNLDSNTKEKSYSLVDGKYRIRVFPWGKGGSQTYLLTVETGTVRSIKALGSNAEISAVNGIYPLRLKPPTFSGTIYKPGGTTPAANVYLLAENSKYGGWGAWTDSEGKFSIDIDPSITDATFTLKAQPNRQTYNQGIDLDRTIARSSATTESVTAGIGRQNISIILTSPTVTGRITGSKAALINRDITFQKLDGAGNWNWTNIYSYTDKSGDFVEYLPSGTYRIFAWGDVKGAGGGETYGNACVINAESGTAVTCNLALVAPNVTGTAKYNGVAIAWGDIQFQPDYSIKTNIPRRGYGFGIDQGYIGGTLQPDTYQTSIWFALNGKYVRVFGPKCVVPETGTVTCDVNLPAINLSYKVLDTNNNLLTSNVYSTLEIKSGDSWNGSCCSYPDSNLRDGKFETTLVDGQYRLGVRPDNASISGTTQLYTFTVDSGTVRNFVKEGSTETVTTVNGVYITKLRPAAVTGVVYKSDGTTVYNNARVCARPGDQGGTYWRVCSYTNNAGKFTIDQNSITDGTWIVQAFATSDDLTQGSSIQDSVTVSSGLGSKLLSLNLRAPTVTGTVTGPKGASPNNYINVRKYYDNGGYDYLDMYFFTDSQGRFAFTLDPGRYKVIAQNDMAVAGGTSAMSSDCIVTAGQSSTCNISLQEPNVTGTVKIAGQIVSASVELIRETSNGFDYTGYSSGTNQSGGYYLTVTPGTYRTRIYLYNTGNWMVGPACIVQSGANSTCDINLPATNLQFKVTKASGGFATTGIYAYLEYLNNERSLWAGYTNGDSAGLFKNSLTDGKYRLTIQPNGLDATIGTYVVYLVSVESGTVTSLTREGSISQLTASAGVYSLSLGVPSISGTVVAGDGTTPVPNSRVYAFDNPKWAWGSESDQNAAFGFAKLPDGTYSIIAAPPYGDATKAPSAPTQVKVTNGVGANDLKLTLRTPNVTGVVRGTSGKVSAKNWIYVEQKMNGGWWSRPDYFLENMTSAEGSYSLYLEPGIYRVRANSDMNGAGGVASGVICTVPNTGNVVCNITLKSPNLKIRIVEPNTTTYNRGSWAWTYLKSSANEDAVLNRNPGFEWDQSGNYQAVLEDGTWVVRTEGGENPLYSNTEFTVEVNSGIVTKVSKANGETITATSGTYMLPLISSNLSGVITFNGVQFLGSAYVQVLRQEGDYLYSYTGKWSYNGNFGFTLPAGNYKIEVTPYSNNQNFVVSTTKSGLCTVESTGTATCNVALKAPNLRGKIINIAGGDAYRFSEAYMMLQVNKGEQWSRWLNITEGLFDSYLEDGTYRIQVMPRWDKRAEYTDRSYTIKVESGTVTAVVDLLTGLPLTPSNGRYSFLLGTPSVKGRVFYPDRVTGVAYANILVAPSDSPRYWRFSAQADANGNFALTVPDGRYVVQAYPTNSGFQYGKSETKTVTISAGILSGVDSVTLVLRNPNLTGRIVTPGASPQPLANVNVNINVDGEYFYAWTDSEGRFGAYVDNPAPACPARCSINLNYYKSSEYTPKSYAISSVGDQGDKAIGGVTTRLTVKVPQAGAADLPSKYSWVTVESVASNGTRTWVTNGTTNENGVVGLALDTGVKYWIWAYPNGEQSNSFAPKKLEIPSFSPDTQSALSLTFDLPNVKLRVLSSTNTDNTYGWYTVSTWDSATSTATKYSNASLDGQGLSALTLPNGDYQLRFWPGKEASGVQKVVNIRVNGSTITRLDGNSISGDSISGSLLTLKLPGGNVSGFIQSASGTPVSSAMVAAYLASDLTKFVTTSTDSSGYYQLNLDLSGAWIVKAVDPISGYLGSLNISARGTSNEVISAQNVSLTTAP